MCVCVGGGGSYQSPGVFFCLQVDGPISGGGGGGGGLIIGSLRYLFFGISFYRMRFRSLRPLLAVRVKM